MMHRFECHDVKVSHVAAEVRHTSYNVRQIAKIRISDNPETQEIKNTT